MDIGSVLGDALQSVLESILHATLFKLLYYVEIALCWIIGQLYDMFGVFAGLQRATYKGEPMYLFNIFFNFSVDSSKNSLIVNIYWAMALVGIALTFGFAIWSVAKKTFDAEGKVQTSMSQILSAAFKSILLIVSLTLVMFVVTETTSRLMQSISFIFDNAYHLDQLQERDFTDEEYSAMGRVLMTIGNYSMTPNSNNRYNMNLCYNEIRSDMLFLQKQGVFDYNYYRVENDRVVESWQSVLAQIAKAHDLTRDMKVDVYNDGITRSIGAAMTYLRSNPDPMPVSHATIGYYDTEPHLDRLVFLLGTFRAAKNQVYNENPGFEDALRAPYYYDQGRDIYEFDDVDSDFDIGFATDYIVVFLASVAIIMDLVIILLNCVARIFNMLFLYIIAPPVIAAMPLDGGGKFKQWTTAFLVQSLSVFGTVIAMRLLIIYLTIVTGPQLVLFEDRPLLNVLAKFFLIYGGIEASKKATGLLTGILADSAGWQSIQAGDMSSSASKLAGGVTGAAKGAAGKAVGLGLGAAKTTAKGLSFAAKPLRNLGGRAWANTGGKIGNFWSNLGKGDVKGNAIKAKAQEKLAVKQEMAKMEGGGSKAPGSGSGSLPGSQSGSGDSGSLPGSQNSSGGSGGAAKGPEPAKTPPPLARRGASDVGAARNQNQLRDKMGFGAGSAPDQTLRRPQGTESLPTSNRPKL